MERGIVLYSNSFGKYFVFSISSFVSVLRRKIINLCTSFNFTIESLRPQNQSGDIFGMLKNKAKFVFSVLQMILAQKDLIKFSRLKILYFHHGQVAAELKAKKNRTQCRRRFFFIRNKYNVIEDFSLGQLDYTQEVGLQHKRQAFSPFLTKSSLLLCGNPFTVYSYRNQTIVNKQSTNFVVFK